MNESKLNMSKLAAESGQKSERSKSDPQNDMEKLAFSRLGDVASDKDDIDVSARKEEERLYQTGLKFYADAYAAVQADNTFSIDPAISLIKKIITSLDDSDVLLVSTVHQDYQQDTIIFHSLNVAILSLLIGSHLGISRSGLVKLGVTALLHDIGTARIPDSLYNKPSRLTETELRKLRQRTLLSHEILTQLCDQRSYLAEIALQVYERLDGSGYPSGLKGGDIHEYAQIIGLADWYEAMVHSRPHRERFLPFSAIKEILRSGKRFFGRRHLKAMVDTLSLFPVLTCVRLNSGAIGRVMETFPRDPLRPRLKILFDSQNKPVSSERIIDLRDNTLLFVTDAVSDDTAKTDSV